MLRLLLLLPVFAALSGCVTTSSGSDAVREENQSTVLLHTSLHDANCPGISMSLTQRDASGRWLYGRAVSLKTLFDGNTGPSQITLPPGEYGIAGLDCQGRKIGFHARIEQSASIWTGRPLVYEKPIATFNVLPNEVVDIGSLRVPSGWGTDRDGRRKQLFVGVVTPMPEERLRTLAEKHPELYRRRVTRPMKAAINI